MKFETLRRILIIPFLIFMLIECQTISSVQNIRQVDSATDRVEIDELTIMTFNIRVGGGVKHFGSSPNSLSESKVEMTTEN